MVTENVENQNDISASSAICLPPAAAAIQKIFNCTKLANSNNNFNNNNNNRNLNGERDCLSSITALDKRGIIDATYNNNHNNSNSSRKKFTNVKAHLIAKKNKFWQYLEEQKLRNLSQNDAHGHSHNMHNTCTTCTPTKINKQQADGSGVKKSTPILNMKTETLEKPTCGDSMSPVKVLGKCKKQNNLPSAANERKDKSNNWSGIADNNTEQEQQQQYQQQWHNNNKSSSYDLYSEAAAAAQLLGLSCTLCDNCRCLDCQSGYFDCDDWETNSELSFMDEFDEQFVVDTSTRFCMQSCTYYDGMPSTITCNENAQQSYNLDANASATTTMSNDWIEINCQRQQHCTYGVMNPRDITNNSHEVVDVQNQQLNNTIPIDCSKSNCSLNIVASFNSDELAQPLAVPEPRNNELENCASFNELSLLDSKADRKSEQQEIVVQ